MTDSAPKFKTAQLREAIVHEYEQVASDPDSGFHFNTGREVAERFGYTSGMLDGIPESATAAFAGVGNPFSLGPLQTGENVVDLGSGGGMDVLIASRLVGESGSVTGVDMTAKMRARATGAADLMGSRNVRFVEGFLEDLPLNDASIDVVISNGVINLCLDKSVVFGEIFRILKPGGRIQIADILLERPVPNLTRDLIFLWAQCVAGAVPQDDYVSIMTAAGFQKILVAHSHDTFQDAEVEPRAREFGARGYDIRAVKPA